MKTVVIKLHLTKKKFSTVYSSSTERSDTASSSSSKSSSTKPDRRHRKLFSSTTDNQNECQQQNHIIETRSRAKNAVTISSMPDELLMRIFSHLPLSDKFRAASVCKRWNSIVYDALNWTQLSLDEWESATAATTDTTSSTFRISHKHFFPSISFTFLTTIKNLRKHREQQLRTTWI